MYSWYDGGIVISIPAFLDGSRHIFRVSHSYGCKNTYINFILCTITTTTTTLIVTVKPDDVVCTI